MHNTSRTAADDLVSIQKESFGKLSTGEQADLFTLKTTHGLSVKITNYGGIITAIHMPDSKGNICDVVLGYDNIKSYEEDTYYLGAIVGRYAGRIKDGIAQINNKEIQLTLNADDSQLHGGSNGLNKQLWQASTKQYSNKATLTLLHVCPDGYNGFPGNVTFIVKYTLNNKNQLTVEYHADTDKPTIVNLTQHSYFNLAGHNTGSILGHQVQLNASQFLPMTKQAYPTGEITDVACTPHDFTTLCSLEKNLDSENEQIKIGKGYDNYWLLNQDKDEGPENESADNIPFIAQVVEPNSGRRLSVFSDQPSVILYTGNYLDSSHIGKNNTAYQYQHGLCIEPQRAFDQSLGSKAYQPFQSTTLLPNAPFYSKNIYAFDCV